MNTNNEFETKDTESLNINNTEETNKLEELMSNDKFKKLVINRLMPFPVALKQTDRYSDKQAPSYIGKCFCPFHENYDTPAAKISKTDRGDMLYCFSERKSYRPADLFTRYYKEQTGVSKDLTVDTIFRKIWAQIPIDKRQWFIEQYNQQYNENGTSTYTELVKQELDDIFNNEIALDFRKGNITNGVMLSQLFV